MCMQAAMMAAEEEEDNYIHVPSPFGLIGWNIEHMPEVFEGVTCLSRALSPNARTIDIVVKIVQDIMSPHKLLGGDPHNYIIPLQTP